MPNEVTTICDNIIEQSLFDAQLDGWSWKGIETAAQECGYGEDMAASVFPDELDGALGHFADWADRKMLQRLECFDPEQMRVRDRVRQGVLCRYAVLEPYKEAVRYALAHWAVPGRQARAGKILWRTADKIWKWAGDTSTDYNYYTKRGLLSSVIASTTLVWLNDPAFERTLNDTVPDSPTHKFLDARIDNVLTIGKNLGKFKSFVS